MNILHINTIDIRGGAAKACQRLVNEQKKRGHTVSTFVGYKYSNDPTVHKIPLNPLYYKMSNFFANDLCFSRSNWILKTDKYKKADVIHCHNIHSGFFNLKTLETISKEKPTVWTLQDMWAITSGSTDSYHLKTEKPRRFCKILWDNRKYLLEQKKKIYKNSRFTVVTSSQWMAKNVEKSILSHLDHRLILNGIDLSIFNPKNKVKTRKELNLPEKKKIALFIAVGGIVDLLKGSSYVEQIANVYKKDGTKLFVAIGGKKNSTSTKTSNQNIFQTGYISDEKLLAKYYGMADFFLYPSRADNSPLVVSEAMACGTPVVSFETDGIPEMVSNCGLLAKRESLEDLKVKVNQMFSISPKEYSKMCDSGIERTKQKYSIEKMANEYFALYSEIISKFKQ